VKHGYTFTKSVMFKDVVKSIKKFTDLHPTHTPIILSLEVHCNEENQQNISSILEEHFTDKKKNIDKIVRVNPNTNEFPSLEECTGMLVIKGPGSFKLYQEQNKNNKGKSAKKIPTLTEKMTKKVYEQVK
jgi:phosphatidylinositol phospholipase C, delta